MALGLIERSMKGPDYERVAESDFGADESCGVQPEPVLSGPERPAARRHPLRILYPGHGYLDIDRSKVRSVTSWSLVRIRCGTARFMAAVFSDPNRRAVVKSRRWMH